MVFSSADVAASVIFIERLGKSAELVPVDEVESCPPVTRGSAVYQSSQYPTGTLTFTVCRPDPPVIVEIVVRPGLSRMAGAGVIVTG